jgi:P4 family phage/plasmid primase-like protien
MNIEKFRNEYTKKQLITFSFNLEQKFHDKDRIWKKYVIPPNKWTELKIDNDIFNKNNNSIGMLTGKINEIFVIDIDDIDDWNYLLKQTGNKEPKTVKAISGRGGIHLFFKYSEILKDISSKSCAITYDNKPLKIDVRTNGGFIIVAPSRYYDKNINKETCYKWKKSIIDNELLDVPEWLINLLIKKNDKIHCVKIQDDKEQDDKEQDDKEQDDKEELLLDGTEEIDSEILIEILNNLKKTRKDNRNEWRDIGMAIKSTNPDYFEIWNEWSKESNKYDEKEVLIQWKSFKTTGKIHFGSLLFWLNEDNPEICKKVKNIIKHKKTIINTILDNKNNFKFGKYKVKNLNNNNITEVMNCDTFTCVKLVNIACPFIGKINKNHNIFIDLSTLGMVMRCSNSNCIGKVFPSPPISVNYTLNYYANGNNNDIMSIESAILDDNIKIFNDSVLNDLMLLGLAGRSYDSASLIIKLTQGKYCYGKDNKWYAFKEHKWIQDESIDTYISGDFSYFYKQLYEYYAKKGDINKKNHIMKYYIQLGDKDKKYAIKDELKRQYHIEYPNFLENLDNISYLIGFNNGVYDLKKMEFRAGKPEDMISMTCGYDYIDKYSENKKDLINFLNDLLPKDDLKYLLTYLATGIVGENILSLFTILTGIGRNGKSKFVELIKVSLGNYFGNPKCKLLTGSRPEENAPEPGLLALKKKRIVIVSEPQKGDKLNSGFIKFLTGNDNASLRGCHKNELEDFKANFISLLICNDIPDVDNIDNAFSKRLRCINFPTEFIDNPKLEHQKKINENIKVDIWKNNFMLILIEHYKIFLNEGLKIPQNVFEWTNLYKEDTDIYHTFLFDRTEESEIHISMIDLYINFKDWFREAYPAERVPNNRDFFNGIKKHKLIYKSIKFNKKTTSGIKNLILKKNDID